MLVEVTVHPNSKKPKVEKNLLNQLHIYVNAPAREGKANKAVLEVLSRIYKVPKTRVILVKGTTSKIKVFSVNK
jgi:uncharacterized protein (TIGR00251 family)